MVTLATTGPPIGAGACEGSRASNVFSRTLWWAGLSNIGCRAISVSGTLLLAAILAPKDFGYLAIVTVVVALAQSVFGAAFTPALVQSRGAVEEVAAAALWIALGASGAIYLGLWFLAPALGTYYGMPQLSMLIRVSAVGIVANSASAVPLGLLQRRGEFKKFLMVGLVSQISGTGISIVLALRGAGVWALVLGLVANALVTAALAFVYARWRPRIGDFRSARPVIGFSLWVIAGGIQTWLFLYGDNAIASRSFSTGALGVYVMGFNLANMLPGIVTSVVSVVASPALCQVNRASPANVPSTFLDIQTVTATLVLPIACLTAALAEPLATLVFRRAWADLGFTIEWLAILPGMCAVWSLNADGYRAIGRPDLWPKISAASVGVLLPCLVVAARYGPHAFVITRCVAALPLPLLNMAVTARVLRISLHAQLAHLLPALIGGGALLCATSGLLQMFHPAAPALRAGYLIFCGCAGLGVYLFILRITGPHVWERARTALRSLRTAPRPTLAAEVS